MRLSLTVVVLAAATAIACRGEIVAPLTGSGLKLDLRVRRQCMQALADQAAETYAILIQIRQYSPAIRAFTDAEGMCRDHWGLAAARAVECADRLAVLVGITPSGAPDNPCVSGVSS